MRVLALAAFFVAVHSATAKSSDGHDIWDIPGALRLIRTADEVYVMPVKLTEKHHQAEVSGTYTTVTPHGDFKHVRPVLDRRARRELQRLLASDSSWCHCLDSTFPIGPEPKYVGYVFQRGKDKLLLLRFLRWRTDGIFNGEPTGGSLEEKASDKLDEWEKRYARPERGLK